MSQFTNFLRINDPAILASTNLGVDKMFQYCRSTDFPSVTWPIVINNPTILWGLKYSINACVVSQELFCMT